jgi:glycerol-1-phosphate dehydrogenase [NAD(P)+]
MEPHSIELPRKILMGNGVSNQIEKVCKELREIGTPLILTGPLTKKIIGDKIFRDMKNLNPRMEIIRKGTLEEAEKIWGNKLPADIVISVGGGSVIDVGKVVAMKKKADFICVPTAPSHDGIFSGRANLRDGRKKPSMEAKMPLAIIADIKIIKNAPHRLVASGFADMVAKITAVYDWKLASKKGEYYSDFAAEIALIAAKKAMGSAALIRKREERGIRNLMQALITSGASMAIAGSSRPASGAEHAISHVLDSEGSKALHGEQCGVASIVTACLQGQDWWKIRDSLTKAGAPTTAKQLGIKGEKFLLAIVKAKDYRDRYTILNEKDVDMRQAEKACRDTGVC